MLGPDWVLGCWLFRLWGSEPTEGRSLSAFQICDKNNSEWDGNVYIAPEKESSRGWVETPGSLVCFCFSGSSGGVISSLTSIGDDSVFEPGHSISSGRAGMCVTSSGLLGDLLVARGPAVLMELSGCVSVLGTTYDLDVSSQGAWWVFSLVTKYSPPFLLICLIS